MDIASPKLCNRTFVVVNVINFLAICNMALFFRFDAYLAQISLDPSWHGLVISLFALVAVLVRPFISHRFTAANAGRWMALTSLGVAGCMVLYSLAQSLESLIVLRIGHGLFFVILITAATAPMVGSIPEGRGGQAFGIITVTNLLPMAFIPPLVIALMTWLGSYPRVLAWSALLTLLVAFLVPVMNKGLSRDAQKAQPRLTWSDLRGNLRNHQVLCLLAISLLIYTAFAPVFFFVQDYAQQRGLANPGWFFTTSAAMEVASRLLAGRLFDRVRKTMLLGLALLLLVVANLAMIMAQGQIVLLALGLALGLGWGVGMPMLSAIMFELSPARFRAMNTNLSQLMFQGGFFLGPLLGRALLTALGYAWMFVGCAALCLLALAGIPLLVATTQQPWRPAEAKGGHP